MHDVPGSHWHEPMAGKRAGFGKFGRPKTPYDLFMESEGVPVFRDIGVSKVQNLPLAPWKRLGGRGTYIQLHGTEGKWGCYLVEVPGAGALNPEKHLYEEIYFVVEGRGSTEVWLDNDSKRHVFEWQKGSLFSIPVNAMHRIVNAGSSPALLLGGTTAPNLMNLINNVGAIFDCPYQFRDRFSGADGFYKYKDDIEPDPVRGLAMRRTNFIPTSSTATCRSTSRRSPGFRRVERVHDRQYVLLLGRPARKRPLLQGPRPHLRRGAGLHQGQGLHVHLAGACRRQSMEGRKAHASSSGSTTSRWASCPPRPAARAGTTSISAAPRSRCGSPPGSAPTIPAASPAPRRDPRRLHRHGHHRRRQLHPYWMEDPYIAKEYTEILARNGAENRMDPQFYDKNYKGELPKGV
jgi:mannose-6-phosphate isomerase-like protein (cupin superfamily)